MRGHEAQNGGPREDSVTAAPGGLLDLLRVAAMVADADGRIVLWSPEAELLLGYSDAEALGRNAGELLVSPENRSQGREQFERVRAGARWAGVFPVLRKDGSTRQVEFRTMRLRDAQGDVHALGLATDAETVRKVERDLALSHSLIKQTPIGIAVFDTDLRWVSVNPALERMNGLPEEAVRGPPPRRKAAGAGRRGHRVADAACPGDRQATAGPADRRPDGRGHRGPRLVGVDTTGSRTPAAACWAWPSPSSTSPSATGRPSRSRRRASGWR